MLGRGSFFGERCSQFRDCASGVVNVGEEACCCTRVGDWEIVDEGDSGPIFVTNNGPIRGAGRGDPGASGVALRSKNPGTLWFFDRRGVSLVSRECVAEMG